MALIHRGTSGPWHRSVPATALAAQAKLECIQGYMPFSHHTPLLCSPGELQSPAEDLKVLETINKQNFTRLGSSEFFSVLLLKGWRSLGVKNCPPPSETSPPEPSPCAQPCSFLFIPYSFFLFQSQQKNILFVLKCKVTFAKYNQLPFVDKIGKV